MKKIVFLTILFLVFSTLSYYSQSNKIGKIVPPDILPVVILQGSDYQMGFQYGQQAGEYIKINLDAAWAEALEKYTREKVLYMLKGNLFYIKKHTPECIDIMKGIRDGVNSHKLSVTFSDILLLNCTLPNPDKAKFPKEAKKIQLPADKKCSVCSAWGKATKDGQLIGMDTLDSGEALYGVVIVAYPDTGNNYICGAQAGEISDHFLMNNQGLFLGNSGGGGSVREGDDNYGLSWSCSLAHLIRFSNIAKEGMEKITKWQINIPENFHFVDISGDSYVVEKTAAVQSTRSSGDFDEKDFMYSTNNYLNKKMKVTKKGDFVKKHGGFGAYAAPRNLMLWDMLKNYHGQVDVEFMKMILRFPGNPPPLPPKGGWDAKICRPSNGWVSVVIPHKGDQGVAHICTGPAGQVIHSSAASNGDTMQANYLFVNGTHTFFTLKLAKNPKTVAKEAKKSTRLTIAKAYQKLMLLNYKHAGYADLNKLYSKATAEYFLANQAFNQSILNKGDTSIQFLAKSVTLYARSMAHAEQVFEAISPPPTSPSDLGLKSFGGNWAKWETKLK